MKRTFATLLAFLLLSLNLACGFPEPPQIVTISNAPVFRPTTPEDVKTLEQAMAAIITVCKDDLKLPVVDPLHVYLYRGKGAFVAHLSRHGLLPGVTKDSMAVAQGNRIHVNMEGTEIVPKNMVHRLWGGLVAVLAHEYAHTVASNLRGSRATEVRWISEGFADWVAAKVSHFLGWHDYDVSVYRARQELLRQRDSLLLLSDLEKSSVWDDLGKRPNGDVLTYRLAFLAVDRLNQKGGLQGLINYFKSGDFTGSFGVSLHDLDTDLKNTLSEEKLYTQTGLKVPKPDWKVGYLWQYVKKRAGATEMVVRELIREDAFEGVPSYVMRVSKDEVFYAKNALSTLAVMLGGKLISKNNPPGELFSWPLEVGKEWRSSYTRQIMEPKLSFEENFLRAASNFESVEVPAGTFEVVKIDTYDFDKGTLVSEHWYSPQVRWFVKIRRYYGRVPESEEEELISFKVD